MLQAAIHQDENFKKLDRDNYIQDANDELKHIIGMYLLHFSCFIHFLHIKLTF